MESGTFRDGFSQASVSEYGNHIDTRTGDSRLDSDIPHLGHPLGPRDPLELSRAE